MRHLDLFSGIGGFALATEMVWDNVEHVFCDNDPFSQAILKKHWPNSLIYGDIKTLTNPRREHGRTGCGESPQRKASKRGSPTEEIERFGCSVDLLTGGFPCQPFSAAGARRGTEDSRHLWPEMLRVIREFHPRWVIGENVGGLVTWSEGMVLEQIHLDLENEGYEVQAFIIPAVSVNAPHRRDRIWIVAHATSSDGGGGTSKVPQTNGELRKVRQDKGASKPSNANKDTPDSKCKGYAGDGYGWKNQPGQRGLRDRKGQQEGPDWSLNWPEVAATLCRMDDGIPRRLDRNPRLKALGNAIVPQVAAEIMKAIIAI